jgi:hypothetical protein
MTEPITEPISEPISEPVTDPEDDVAVEDLGVVPDLPIGNCDEAGQPHFLLTVNGEESCGCGGAFPCPWQLERSPLVEQANDDEVAVDGLSAQGVNERTDT